MSWKSGEDGETRHVMGNLVWSSHLQGRQGDEITLHYILGNFVIKTCGVWTSLGPYSETSFNNNSDEPSYSTSGDIICMSRFLEFTGTKKVTGVTGEV